MPDISEALKQIKNARGIFQGVITMVDAIEEWGDIDSLEKRVIKNRRELESVNASLADARQRLTVENSKVAEIEKQNAIMANEIVLEARKRAQPFISEEEKKLEAIKVEIKKGNSELVEVTRRVQSTQMELAQIQDRIAAVKAKAVKEMAL